MKTGLIPIVPVTDTFEPFSSVSARRVAGGVQDHVRSILSQKVWIAVIVLAAATAMAFYAFTLQPVFRSTATVLIETNKPRALALEDAVNGSAAERSNYLTQIEILKSRNVAKQTVERLRLWEVPDFDPRLGRQTWTASLSRRLGLQSGDRPWTQEELADAATDEFTAALTIEPVRLSSLARISVDAHDKALAAQSANEVVKSYINADEQARSSVAEHAESWLQHRIDTMQVALQTSEQALQTYREQHGVIGASGSAPALADEQIRDLSMRQIEARTKRIETNAAYAQIKAVTNGDFSRVSAVVRDPEVIAARRAEDAAALKLAELSQRFGTNHASVIEAKVQLESARANVSAQSQVAANAIVRDHEVAVDTERSIGQGVSSVRDSAQDLNRHAFKLNELEREVQANRQLYDLLVTRSKETAVGNEIHGPVARLIDVATVSRIPVKPQKTMMVAGAAVSAFLLSCLAMLFKTRFDTSIRSAYDAESRIGYRVLASIPPIGIGGKERAGRVFLTHPTSAFAEAIRTARTNLLLSGDASGKMFMVTSSERAEDKTTLSCNLAMAHARTRRTLLIDANLRHPGVADAMGLPADVKGLTELLAGKANIGECVHYVIDGGMWVLPAGQLTSNAIELFLSKGFKSCLQSLAQQFEIILIDTPPVEVVSDALVLAPLTDGVIYAVRAHKTSSASVRSGLTKVERAGARVAGLVLTCVGPEAWNDMLGMNSTDAEQPPARDELVGLPHPARHAVSPTVEQPSA